MKQRYSEEQIIAILHEAAAAPIKAEVYRTYGISEQTSYRWRQLYGGLDVAHLRRLQQLEAENARLQQLEAENARLQQLEAENARLKRWWRSRCWRTRPSLRSSKKGALRERQ